MVSERSIKMISRALNLGYFIGAIPSKWDTIKYCIILKYGKSYRIPFCNLRTPRSGLIWAGIYLLIQVLHILYLILFILYLEHSFTDLYISSFLLVCSLYSTFVQLLIVFFYFEEIANLVNAFFFLDLKIRK